MPLENSRVEAEFEIGARIERPVRFAEEPFPPVGILLANLANLWPAAPARAVVIPYNLHFADASQRAARNPLPGRSLVWFAAVLGADLHYELTRPHGVPRGLRLLEHIGHRLLAVSVLARFGGQLEKRRVLKIRGGNDYGVDIF